MSNRIDDLEIYNLSEAFADKIWFIAVKWDFFAKDTIGKQLVRSADSIGANIAEGFGRFHYKENKTSVTLVAVRLLKPKAGLKKQIPEV